MPAHGRLTRRRQLSNVEHAYADRAAAVRRRRAELVVPRSMPIEPPWSRRRSGLALPDVQLQLPALRRRRATTHQSSSVPISVTRLSSVTGTTSTSCCPLDAAA